MPRQPSIFRFKQFDIDQGDCAMRINTDGVLLAAIACAKPCNHILDVGTGTGVIALMLAQKYDQAKVDAVEIDQHAAEQAGLNARNSKFKDRVRVYGAAFEDFQSSQQYDLIVSNPPFFVNDLKNADERKGLARHASPDFFLMFITKATSLLKDQGKIWMVLPVKQANEVLRISENMGLYLKERIHIHSDQTKPTFRQIICLSQTESVMKEEDLYIYESEGRNTLAYTRLLKDFFLFL